MTQMLRRRTLLAGAGALTGAATLAAPRIARAEAARVLKFIPHADLTIVDPSWTPLYITRNHAMLVYDTLYGTDAAYNVSPQMLAGDRVSADGLVWDMTLREGLKFHDGTPVLAADCVASIKRWGARDNFGQTVLAVTDELSAPDDRTIRFRLKRPFPLLPKALGKPGSSICAIMPARLAGGDATKPITEVVGSGPFRFVKAEWMAGARVVYERNPDYVPRQGGATSFTAGPKIVNFDRVEWHIVPDAATAGAALQAGEVDWWEVVSVDLVDLLRRNAALKVAVQDKTGFTAYMRMNHLTPPFNNPAIRRAVLGAVSQEDYMTAAAGSDPAMWHTGAGFFCPGTPMASDAGMSVLTAPRDLARVKREIEAAGYRGEKVVVLIPSDVPTIKAMGEVGADMLKRAGFNVEGVMQDFGTMAQRLYKVEASDQGGWNAYHSYWAGLDQMDPAVNMSLRAVGRVAGRPGWPDSPKLEALREEWLRATDLAEQKRIASEIQVQAFQDVPYIPVGQMFQPTAYRKDITGVLDGYALFWNVRRG